MIVFLSSAFSATPNEVFTPASHCFKSFNLNLNYACFFFELIKFVILREFYFSFVNVRTP